MSRKIIFFDIDGTLVSHAGISHIPKPTAQAVNELRRGGHVTAIATARNLALTRKTAALLGIELAVCCNGSHAVEIPGEGEATEARNLYEAWLDDSFTRVFRDEACAFSEQAYALDAGHVYTDWDKDFMDAFIAAEAGPSCKKSVASLERAQLGYIFAPLPAHWGLTDVDAMEFPGYTEFRPRGVSKWSGVLKAAAAAGFGEEDIVTVGDGLNDIEMVRGAPLGIAVGGARDELKAAADFVTGDIDEGGILSAFRALGLLKI